jgi:hypothetical protein
VKHWRYILVALAFAGLITLAAIQPHPAAVSVVVQGFETNAYDGGQDCVLVLTNASREQFTVLMQAQVNGPSGWAPVEKGFYGNRRNASYRPDLPAFSKREVSFPLAPPNSQWRVVLLCYQENPANLKGLAWLRRRVHSLLFGVYPEYYFTSPEMPPNPAAAGNGVGPFLFHAERSCRAVPEKV